MTSPMTAPAAMPSVEERFAAAYLGFNPHDASTWDADIVNRLVRIRSERGDQAFVQEVANLTTPPANTVDHWKARALAAEAALAAERERCAGIAEAWRGAAVMTPGGAMFGANTPNAIAAAIRAQGE